MRKHWYRNINFIILAIILIATLFLFWLFRSDKTMQMTVGILLSILYTAWGIIHHSMTGDLYPKIVIEYLLVGIIAVTLIMTVVWI